MPFTIRTSITSAAIGSPASLGHGHIDLATLDLSFVYFQYAQDEQGTWHSVQEEQALVVNEHYALDVRDGVIKLLDHPFWHQQGLWRAADREEPLLYKGRIKWPQVILFEYEHYAPEEIVLPEKVKVQGTIKIFREADVLRMVDFTETDEEALTRLGYELPKYVEASNDNL